MAVTWRILFISSKAGKFGRVRGKFGNFWTRGARGRYVEMSRCISATNKKKAISVFDLYINITFNSLVEEEIKGNISFHFVHIVFV